MNVILTRCARNVRRMTSQVLDWRPFADWFVYSFIFLLWHSISFFFSSLFFLFFAFIKYPSCPSPLLPLPFAYPSPPLRLPFAYPSPTLRLPFPYPSPTLPLPFPHPSPLLPLPFPSSCVWLRNQQAVLPDAEQWVIFFVIVAVLFWGFQDTFSISFLFSYSFFFHSQFTLFCCYCLIYLFVDLS